MLVEDNQGKLVYRQFTVDSRKRAQSGVMGGKWRYKVKAQDGTLQEVDEESLELT